MTENTELDLLLQKEWRESILPNFGTESWVRVYQKHDLGSSEYTLMYSGFVTAGNLDVAKRSHGWRIFADQVEPMLVDGFDDVAGKAYTRFEVFGENDGIVPLVVIRTFGGFRRQRFEILQDFCFFHSLYLDSENHQYLRFNEMGAPEPVVRVFDDHVLVRRREMRQYLAARQLYLITFIIRAIYSYVEVDAIPDSDRTEDVSSDGYAYRFWVEKNGRSLHRDTHSISKLHAKTFVEPESIEKSNLYPFSDEKTRNYVSFLIGVDDCDQDVSYTCDPNSLGPDYADHTDLLPDYCIPVWFSDQVLADDDSFHVYQGGLGGTYYIGENPTVRFSIPMPGYITVELGQLGNYLPFQEQSRWRSYNVSPIDDRWFQHSNLVDFHNNTAGFMKSYEKLQSAWHDKYGWYLFHELAGDDNYHLDELCRLVANTYSDIDRLSLSISKLITDSINVDDLGRCIPSFVSKMECDRDKPKISVLQEYLECTGYEDHENHIKYLRDVQMLRSRIAAHRKSRTPRRYEEVLERLRPDYRHFIQVADAVFANLAAFLDSLRTHFCPDETA